MQRVLKIAVSATVLLFLFLALNAVVLRYAIVALVTVSGSSMFPNISPGDTLLCVSTKLTGIQVGDVYVYSTLFGRYVVHRIIEQRGNMYLFKGDNNLHVDGFVAAENIVCKVVLRVPRTVWVPVLSLALGTCYVYSLARRKRTEQFLSVSVVLIMITVISTGVIMLHEPDIYVKPNPTPLSIYTFAIGGKTYIVIDNWHLVESVECSDMQSPVNCRLVGAGFVEVDSRSPVIVLQMKLRSYYNLVVVETVVIGDVRD